MCKRKTTAQFIEEAKAVHGDRYDYSKSVWIDSKIEIICKDHGSFWQTRANHVSNKRGCYLCNGGRKRNTGDFITKAKEKHGERYDYSKTRYINSATPVVIICKDHGEFKQTPNSHLTNKGCMQCAIDARANKRRNSKDDILQRIKKVHGDKLDYSAFEYHGYAKKSKLICEKHGIFEKSPYNLIRGQGCPQCTLDRISIALAKDQSTAISEFKAIHGDRYIYDLVEYKGGHKKIMIICRIHGVFEQTPANHRSGKNCTECAKISTYRKKTKYKDVSHFIKEARRVHGSTYEYDNVVYMGYSIPVLITCKKHGDFLQRISKHIHSGQGCPECKMSQGEKVIGLKLNSMNIEYYYNKSIPEMKGRYRYDFRLKAYKILIEYDGEQHFRVTNNNYFGGKKALKKRQKYDAIKTQWATENGYKLIRIPYWDFDNIEQILKEEILGEKKRFIPKQLLLFK